jgi:hypothetical protein
VRKILTVAVLALAVAACSSSGAGKSLNSSPAGLPGSSVAGATDSQSGPGDSVSGGDSLGGRDPQGLASLPSERVCTLLSNSEAESLLGSPLDSAPSGMLIEGLGTNCLWYTNGISSSIKVEFNTMGYKTQVSFFSYSGTPQSLTIAGHAATGLEAPTDSSSFMKAQLEVSLGSDPSQIGVYIEAPTLDIAKQVAEKVVPRISGLK